MVSTAATFDLEPPPAEHWERMLESVDPSAGHFLIVALDDAGEVSAADLRRLLGPEILTNYGIPDPQETTHAA